MCRSVIISVHTSRAESLTKNLSRSAPRLTGRPRVEALVACGAHQIHTQGMCTREVGGRESGRGRERERACVPVPLSCGGRACTILLQEGGGAQSCSQRRHVNEYGPIAAHTGSTIAGLPRFLTASRRTFARKAHGGCSFPGPSAYCVVHCCPARDKQRRVQPRCPRPDQLSPASSAHTGGRAAPSPLLRASTWLRRRARDGASAAGLANASQAWRVRARTTRYARTCPPCPCAHNASRPHLQPRSRWPGSR